MVDEAHFAATYVSHLAMLIQKYELGISSLQTGTMRPWDQAGVGNLHTPTSNNDLPLLNQRPYPSTHPDVGTNYHPDHNILDWIVDETRFEESTDWLSFVLDPALVALDGTTRLNSVDDANESH